MICTMKRLVGNPGDDLAMMDAISGMSSTLAVPLRESDVNL